MLRSGFGENGFRVRVWGLQFRIEVSLDRWRNGIRNGSAHWLRNQAEDIFKSGKKNGGVERRHSVQTLNAEIIKL